MRKEWSFGGQGAGDAVATAALGGIVHLVDFAIGGSLVVTHGFSSALWGILLAAATIFLSGTR